MNNSSLYPLVLWLAGIALGSGGLLASVLPKRWLAWSKLAGETLPQHTIPPWRALNRLGKALYVLFYTSVLAMPITLLFGSISG